MGTARLFLVALLVAAGARFAEAQTRWRPGGNAFPPYAPAVQSRPATPLPSNPGRASAQNALLPQHQPVYVAENFVAPYWYAYGSGYGYPYWWQHGYVFSPAYVLPWAGWGGWQVPALWPPAAGAPQPAAPAAGNQAPAVPPPPQPQVGDRRATNAESTALGQKFIGYGDLWFAKGKYFEASARYRDAAQSAPQLADAYFREGFALTAMGRYAAAVKAIRRGLAIDPRWPDSPFTLDELYGPNAVGKAAHFAALTGAVRENPRDADVAFLLGVYLYFNGQRDLAANAFDRAARLLNPHGQFIEPFVKRQNALPAPPQPEN
jgi:tetratricopeptide (TPR) repeat protein